MAAVVEKLRREGRHLRQEWSGGHLRVHLRSLSPAKVVKVESAWRDLLPPTVPTSSAEPPAMGSKGQNARLCALPDRH